jgi:hypothetical protein
MTYRVSDKGHVVPQCDDCGTIGEPIFKTTQDLSIKDETERFFQKFRDVGWYMVPPKTLCPDCHP